MEPQDVIDLPTYNSLNELMGADFVVELIDTYKLETDQLIEGLRHALALQDAATFGRLAHSIKSSSASLGALTFSQQARELEMMGKANELAGAISKLEELAAAFPSVVSRLEDLKNVS